MKKPVNFSLTRKRLVAFVITVIILFSALFIRLGYIQLCQGLELQRRATTQWYRELPLGAPRGLILDRNGEILVDNKDVFTVYIRPRAVRDSELVATTLSSIIDVNRDRILEYTKRVVSEVTVKRRIHKDLAEQIRQANLAGVYLAPETSRNYPLAASLSRVLGFTNIDNVGQSGLEVFYDTFLRGLDGFAFTNTDMAGREVENTITRYVPAIPGANLRTTLDRNIQQFADFAVRAAVDEWGARSASMIVMDTRDSGIVAMSQVPSFDLNDPPRNDLDLLNLLSKNTMIVDVFEPGSTFKIFTTAAALEHGLVSINDRFHCAGHSIVEGQRIRCWRTRGHGSQTLIEGVKNSCNVVFMNLASRLGVDRLYDMLEGFGFGERSNVDFFGESPGLMLNREIVKTIDLARIGFGHAVAVTPLQLINGVSAVVNGGILHEPHFVQNISDFQGREIMNRGARSRRRVVSEQTSIAMREILEEVVANGSGRHAGVPGFRIGGKTGTAQKYDETGRVAPGKYVSSFVGFAPANDPRYAILMLVDEPAPGTYYGSLVAAPHVGDVFSRIFEYIALPPQLPIELPDMITMPNLIGRPVEQAFIQLQQLGIHTESYGDGNIVLSTLPIPGTTFNRNSVALLRLSG